MSKWLTLISLLILLTSTCSQQVTNVTPAPEEVQSTQSASSNTLGSESTPLITTLPDLAATEKAIARPTALPNPIIVDTATAAFSLCPGAPGPYAAIGNQVIVVAEDVDKLKLRSEPKISDDTVIRELNRFTQLRIVGGPVCVHSDVASYWFWQVKAPPDGEIGWVAEGDVQHSFIAVSVGGLYAGWTATAITATTPSACSGPHAPLSADGGEATVMTENSDKLKLRSEPEISTDTVIGELDQFTQLKIVGGPLCVTSAETGISYWMWKVKVLSSGKTGWVAEGDAQNEFIHPNIPP